MTNDKRDDSDVSQNVEPQPAARRTFYDEFFHRADEFSRDIITLVPELEAVAIVPSWARPQEHLPAGIIRCRSGAGLANPQEVMHMAEQLHHALRQVMDNSIAILKRVDQEMASMAQEIRRQGLVKDAPDDQPS